MSMWLDPPDPDAEDGLGAGLGLPHDTPSAEGHDTDDLLAPVGDGEDWTPEQGYPDSSQSVRIWVDDARRLTKVRLSNRWRERAKGTSLASMFDEAFLLASAQIGDESSALMPADLMGDSTIDDEPVEALSWDAVAAALSRVDELRSRMAELDAKPADQIEPSRYVGAEAVGLSDNRMVEVTLDLHGATRRITFNDPWLNQSRVTEVCDAVMQAHRAAYAAYQPPTFEIGDEMKLALEAHRLSRQTLALMRQGADR